MRRRCLDLAAELETLRFYLHEIARLPRLTPDAEHDLAVRARDGDEHALVGLVEGNLRFVVSYARRYRGLGVPFLDLIHEGNLGLVEAARRFDPDRRVKFITYAVWWIRQAILHALAEQTRLVALPEKLTGPASRLASHVERLADTLHRAPTSHEIADDLDISDASAEALLFVLGDEVSLSEPVGQREDGRDLGDLLPYVGDIPADVALVHDAARRQIEQALADLEPREREILVMRFGFDGEDAATLQAIGDRLGLSRERVRQIESRAKDKLRKNRRLCGVLSALN